MNNKKLRICFIGWANSIHVQRWVKWFAKQGHEVHLISNIYEDIPGVQVYSLQARRIDSVDEEKTIKKGWLAELFAIAKFNYLSYLKYPGYIKKTRQLIQKIRPDVLQGFYIGFAGYIGAFANFHPFMVYSGGPDLSVFPKNFIMHRVWTKYALSRIDYLLHPSEEANEIAIKMGFAKEKTKSVHFGIDISKFNLDVDPKNLKTQLGIEGHPMILSTRGLFDKYYNITGLLKTFNLVVKELPNARLVIKYNSAPEINKFVRLAHDLGIYDKIVWIGSGNYSEMPRFYRAADVFVSLSFTDSGPVSLLEAMACGCVPVMTKMKNIEEWVKENNGYLVPFGDYDYAASVILEILNNYEKRMSLGRSASKMIMERADNKKGFKEIEDITFDLVNKKI